MSLSLNVPIGMPLVVTAIYSAILTLSVIILAVVVIRLRQGKCQAEFSTVRQPHRRRRSGAGILYLF